MSLALMRDAPGPDAVAELESLLTAEQLATILAVRPKRVYELGIPCLRLSARAIRWRRSAVRAWIEAREGGESR